MGKRILVVDDDPNIVMILTRRLMANGYLVLSASGGEQLLAQLRAFRPDAILLDVMMPFMDGKQVADKLGLNHATATIPIIFISCLIAPLHPQDSPTNPQHHYLGKPFEPEALLGLLKRFGV